MSTVTHKNILDRLAQMKDVRGFAATSQIASGVLNKTIQAPGFSKLDSTVAWLTLVPGLGEAGAQELLSKLGILFVEHPGCSEALEKAALCQP